MKRLSVVYCLVAVLLIAASVSRAALSPETLVGIKDAVVLIKVDLKATATGDAEGGSGSASSVMMA